MTERGAGLEVELSDGHTTFLPFSWLREVTRWPGGECHVILIQTKVREDFTIIEKVPTFKTL